VRYRWISGWGERPDVFRPAAAAADVAGTSTFTAALDFFSENGEAEGSPPSRESRALADVLRAAGSAEILVGSSLGGMLALETAAYFPDCVRAVLLVSSATCFTDRAGEAPPWSWWDPHPAENLERFRAQLRRAPFPALVAFGRSCGLSREEARESARWAVGFETRLEAGLEYLLERDLTGDLERVRVPVGVLHGTADRVIPFRPANEARHHPAVSDAVFVDGGPHALAERFPREVAVSLERLRAKTDAVSLNSVIETLRRGRSLSARRIAPRSHGGGPS
jgi:pimeloyl-ACP methyl ester carboxylesterase